MPAFASAYGTKFPKAVAKITDNFDELLAFYDYPAEYWVHLRTTNPIEPAIEGPTLRRCLRSAGREASGFILSLNRPRGVIMTVAVKCGDGSHRLEGSWAGTELANAFLSHLETRRFSPATVRAYAFDLVCLVRYLESGIGLGDLVPTDVFDWIDWQSLPGRRGSKVVPIGAGRGAAPASVNRRVAAVRAFFEYVVMAGVRAENPVPAPRRGQGLRPKSKGLLGHLGPGRVRGGSRLVRQERRLPESLDPADVSMFLASVGSYRARATVTRWPLQTQMIRRKPWWDTRDTTVEDGARLWRRERGFELPGHYG